MTYLLGLVPSASRLYVRTGCAATPLCGAAHTQQKKPFSIQVPLSAPALRIPSPLDVPCTPRRRGCNRRPSRHQTAKRVEPLETGHPATRSVQGSAGLVPGCDDGKHMLQLAMPPIKGLSWLRAVRFYPLTLRGV